MELYVLLMNTSRSYNSFSFIIVYICVIKNTLNIKNDRVIRLTNQISLKTK